MHVCMYNSRLSRPANRPTAAGQVSGERGNFVCTPRGEKFAIAAGKNISTAILADTVVSFRDVKARNQSRMIIIMKRRMKNFAPPPPLSYCTSHRATFDNR